MRIDILPSDVEPLVHAVNHGADIEKDLIIKVIWARLNDLEAHVAEQDRTIDVLSAAHWRRNEMDGI